MSLMLYTQGNQHSQHPENGQEMVRNAETKWKLPEDSWLKRNKSS